MLLEIRGITETTPGDTDRDISKIREETEPGIWLPLPALCLKLLVYEKSSLYKETT